MVFSCTRVFYRLISDLKNSRGQGSVFYDAARSKNGIMDDIKDGFMDGFKDGSE
jgi:hypothetical protein